MNSPERRSLAQPLQIGTIDSTELAEAMHLVYNRAEQHGKDVWYSRDNEDVSVILVFNEDGDVLDALAGPALTDDDEERLSVEVAQAIEPGPNLIARSFLFSAYPVREVLDARPVLQIVP